MRPLTFRDWAAGIAVAILILIGGVLLWALLAVALGWLVGRLV